MTSVRIKNALISVYEKDGLESLVQNLNRGGVEIYSTGGTANFIKSLGINVHLVEDLTGFPEMLEGRVKTLHPAVFGGILAKRNEHHLEQLLEHNLPLFDLVIVDLYPFIETVKKTNDHNEIIEKIDIGGVSLLRAAAKNFESVTVISQKFQYQEINELLLSHDFTTDLELRKLYASEAFKFTSSYDASISKYFSTILSSHSDEAQSLRYGENPHQKAYFEGDLSYYFKPLSGKALSYNNLLDVDSAFMLMKEFEHDDATCAILKHNNACGVATRSNVMDAWQAALECDPTSAFGGVIIFNKPIDLITAKAIDTIFYEIIIAPKLTDEVLSFLSSKKNRIILELLHFPTSHDAYRSLLGGKLVQEADYHVTGQESLNIVTQNFPSQLEINDMLFAIKCYKHLKSNAIVIVKEKQMIGSGAGQTSRIDALTQAVQKAKARGFDVKGSVLGSDAFFPFADSVEFANNEGITAIVQPGGSMKDSDSIEYCNQHQMTMAFTGIRHFRH